LYNPDTPRWRKPLKEDLQLLIELQKIELNIQQLREQQASVPERITALQENVRHAEDGLNGQQEMLEAVQKSRRLLEHEVEELEERAAKSKQRLLEVKSNKEYQATLKEIEDIEGLIRGREDQIIEHMERAERVQAQLKEQQRLIEEARRKNDREGTQLQKEAEKADVVIKDLEEQQGELRPRISGDLVKKYQFLKSKRGGVALAPVNKGTCQVCHMNLPPQMFIELQKNEEVLSCPNCNRIIYWVGHEAYKSFSETIGEQE
jgi:predicted  nucleic acid-binding Zn-ribbon protein